jgi:1,4-dihydroxy-6-naphthoate synthase
MTTLENTSTAVLTLRVGHSPDPDDAFMFFGFASGAVRMPGWEVTHVLEGIHELNRRARSGELEVTAASAHAYPEIQDHYRIMKVGGSFGRGYGPIVVAREPLDLPDLAGRRVALPGFTTTAALLARLALPRFEAVEVDFDRVFDAVAEGATDAAVVIHEGQLTYRERGFHLVHDLGAAWYEETGLPLPLGIDLVRRDLGVETALAFQEALRASIEHARAHLDEAVAYALDFGRGTDAETGERFVGMYVNDDTLDMGADGRAALELLFRRAVESGFLARMPRLDVLP